MEKMSKRSKVSAGGGCVKEVKEVKEVKRKIPEMTGVFHLNWQIIRI
jgi:hypothetical protein